MPILIVVIAIIVLFGPSFWANHVLKKFGRHEYFSGNGLDLARLMLTRLNMNDVNVEITESGDHYDPEKKVLGLTRARCDKKTLTAVVVAAHEVGHAIQDRDGYAPLRTRTRMIRTAVRLEKAGATIILLVPVLAVLTRVPAAGGLMLMGGFATLCIPVFVHFLTLPCEFDASFNRALPMLVNGKLIPPEDYPAARKILLACALTYVANALVGLLNVWRWIRILRR
ncbi:MAG: zinc metallopeptidase [Desulfobacteraceae bacterium]|nr:zinc metallopeptidase [Desulfobacteraceae bacterium]